MICRPCTCLVLQVHHHIVLLQGGSLDLPKNGDEWHWIRLLYSSSYTCTRNKYVYGFAHTGQWWSASTTSQDF